MTEFMGVALLTQQDWASLYFASPEWFAILWLLPLWWGVLFMLGRGRSDFDDASQSSRTVFKHSLIHSFLATQHKPEPTQKTGARILRFYLQVLRVLILVGVVIALAQPEKMEQRSLEPQTETVRDIVFVVESSASFMLDDYQLNGEPTSRMNVVKSVLDGFMSGLQGNRFGIVLYGEQAYTLMPLTSDVVSARLMLKRLKPYLAGRGDKAMGEAIGLSLQEAEKSKSSTQKRILVLISDGLTRDSRLPLKQVIAVAQAMNLPIYTVGVGSSNSSADLRTVAGLIYQPFESRSLKTIASQTNGEYYRIGSGQDLQRVLQAIDTTEGVVIKKPVSQVKITSFHVFFLFLSLIVLAAYGLLVQLFGRKLARGGE